MPVLRLAFIAFLGRSLQTWVHCAQAPDDICMLQRNTEVSEAPLLPDPESLPTSLQAVIQQLPLHGVVNVTAGDMMRISQKFLVSLRDQHFRDTLHAGLNNFTESLHNFSMKLVRQARNLISQSKNQKLGRTFFLLEHYTLIFDDVMANMAGSAVMLTRTILDAVPQGELATSAEPVRRALSNLTHQKVTDYVTSSVLRPKTKRVFDDRITFCSRFMASMNNDTLLDDALISITGPGVAQAKQMLPLMSSMLTVAMPDVSNEVFDMANSTLEVMSKSLREVNGAFHLIIKAMSEVATNRLNCTIPENMTLEEFSGAQESQAPALSVAAATAQLGFNSSARGFSSASLIAMVASLVTFLAVTC